MGCAGPRYANANNAPKVTVSDDRAGAPHVLFATWLTSYLLTACQSRPAWSFRIGVPLAVLACYENLQTTVAINYSSLQLRLLCLRLLSC
jgi:hypothetical protein